MEVIVNVILTISVRDVSEYAFPYGLYKVKTKFFNV